MGGADGGAGFCEYGDFGLDGLGVGYVCVIGARVGGLGKDGERW